MRTVQLALLALILGSFASIAPAHAVDRVGSGFSSDTTARLERVAVPDTGQHFAFRRTPGPLARCDWFLVFEAGVAVVDLTTNDWADRTLFTNSAGVMRNVGPRDAVGGSLDAHLLSGTFTLTPTARWRHFVGRNGSAEASLGWAENGLEGAHGPIVALHYAPVPQFYAQVGALQYRRVVYDPIGIGAAVIPRVVNDTRPFAGVGVSGAPAAATWTLEALALAAAFVILMGTTD